MFSQIIECMSSSQTAQKKDLESKPKNNNADYLEKKYGKEPKISLEEFRKQRWNWH
jgi:uncharacterized protein YgiB involved in biofilm formation